jgi:hypothetical protein
MKHIKPFNESKENLKEELQDFCETSLAYLLDDGYNVSLSIRDKVKYPEKQHIIASLGLPQETSTGYLALRPYDGYRKFHWDDVKDHYIPFLQMLVRRYELLPYLDATAQVYVCFNTASGFRYLSLDQVINDKTGLDYSIWGINLKILDNKT